MQNAHDASLEELKIALLEWGAAQRRTDDAAIITNLQRNADHDPVGVQAGWRARGQQQATA